MTQEEKDFEELYNKGFDEGFVESSNEEETVEEEPQLTNEELGIETEETQEEQENEEETQSEEEQEEGKLDHPETENEEIDTTKEEQDESEVNNSENEEEASKEDVKYSVKINGQEMELTIDEMKKLAQKGGDYVKKTQELAKYRNYIETIEEAGLSTEDLALLRDAKGGNVDAIGQIVNAAGVDVFDINKDSNYKPEVNTRNYALEDVIDTIKNDSEHGGKIDNYISALPENAKNVFIENPQILQGLYEDQRTGVAEKVMPEVIKSLVMNPNADFLTTYQQVGQKIYNNNASKEEVIEQPKKEVNKGTKKKATLSKKSKGNFNDHKDVWEDDELYEKMKKMSNPYNY